jgi:ATP-dependent exoDNAse (exonuclease V) alpha subunit
MITLSPQQLQAVDAIEQFLRSGRQLFTLHGHAGTGKTTILTSIALAHPEGHLCAFTGKAASVLNRKSGLPATTVHSLIYQLTHCGFQRRRPPIPI